MHGRGRRCELDDASPTRYSCSRMAVDVETEIEIAGRAHEVAAYAADPDNASAWYENIESVEWKTDRPLAVGSQVAFVARFLGRRLAYTYEVARARSGRAARDAHGRRAPSRWRRPTPGRTPATASTRMTLRNRGEPSGFSRVAAPIMAPAMRRANRKDLARLKELLESTRP